MAKGNPKFIQAGAEAKAARQRFIELYAQNPKASAVPGILAEIGKDQGWLNSHRSRHLDFRAALRQLEVNHLQSSAAAKTAAKSGVVLDRTFATFRHAFLARRSPWFHNELAIALDRMAGGDIMLVVWPPEHGKTSALADYATMRLCYEPTMRITVGHERRDHASNLVSAVRSRMENDVPHYKALRDAFGPFAPVLGRNIHGQPQQWGNTGFNLYKRLLGEELDYNMQSLGFNSGIAGTRTDLLLVDDPQSNKTLNLTPKLMERLRDDWFTRPGITGSTVILMNVVGDGDIAAELVRTDTVDHVTVLPAYDEKYLDLGPRPTKADPDVLAVSPWLWPERYDEADYLRLKRNAGPEGWARKYMQEWKPTSEQCFTRAHIDRSRNALRSITHTPPPAPAGGVAEIACAIDPSFARTAVASAAFEPTRLVVLDSYAHRQPRTLSEMIDLLLTQIQTFHRPGVSVVKWVIVETKGLQKGLATDDRLLEYQADLGFEIIHQDTGWDKHDLDLGVAAMARSMERSEIDFPGADDASDARFKSLYDELLDWRPQIKKANRGNARQQDEVMTLWFLFTRWHKLRRRSIRRPVDAAAFGFAPLPGRSPSSDWSFGKIAL